MTPVALREKLARRGHEVAAAVRQRGVEAGVLPGGTAYRRFVVVCAIRTGSTMLGSYLGSHPGVRMFFELFHRHAEAAPFGVAGYGARAVDPAVVRLRNADPVAFLERHVFGRQPPGVHAVGFKLLYTQARRGPTWWDGPAFDRWRATSDGAPQTDWSAARSDLWAHLAADRDLAVVHLTRENPVRGMVSARLAKQTGRWGVGATGGVGEETARATVRLDPAHVLQDLAAGARQRREADALFAGHAVAHVTYEELVEDPGAALARLQAHLGLPVVALETRTRKQNRRPLADVVENLGDVEAALGGTEWADLLGD